VGGLLSFLAGRIPVEGESFELNGYRFKVVSVSERRIQKVLVEKIKKER